MKLYKKIYSKIASLFLKKNKFIYYFLGYFRLIYPVWLLKSATNKSISKSFGKNREIKKRVDYYNKLNECYNINKDFLRLSEFKYKKKRKTYFFDTFQYTRFFPSHYKIKYEFGDVTSLFGQPTIVKSRPIDGENKNSVLLKLNKIRHFHFINDPISFTNKKNKLVWRGNLWKHQTQRIDFLQKYHNHPQCNIGHINNSRLAVQWRLKKMTIWDQLHYKFIMCLEGNDVATNLKWVMSSNSVAVMPKPKFETWFMEGSLIPDFHYIHVEEDFSDLFEKIEFYIDNPIATQQIIQNANKFVKQFKNNKIERIISLKVLEKYFYYQNL